MRGVKKDLEENGLFLFIVRVLSVFLNFWLELYSELHLNLVLVLTKGIYIAWQGTEIFACVGIRIMLDRYEYVRDQDCDSRYVRKIIAKKST